MFGHKLNRIKTIVEHKILKLSAVWIFLILSFTQTRQVLLSRDWYSTYIEQKPVRSGFGETMKEKKPPAFCGLVLACPFHSAANDECPEMTHTTRLFLFSNNSS